jgi:hypothetical protein
MPSVNSAMKKVRHHRADVLELALEPPVGRTALFLLVEARGADDVEAGGLGHLHHQLDVTPKVGGARVEHRRVPQFLELSDPLHADGDHVGPVRAGSAGVRLETRVADGEVLVHERAAQIGGTDAAGHSLHEAGHDSMVAGRTPGSPTSELTSQR